MLSIYVVEPPTEPVLQSLSSYPQQFPHGSCALNPVYPASINAVIRHGNDCGQDSYNNYYDQQFNKSEAHTLSFIHDSILSVSVKHGKCESV